MKFTWLAYVGFILCAVSGVGQVSVLTNNVVSTADYIGCDNLSNQPLRLITTLNYSMDFSTTNTPRARLSPNVTTAMGPLNEYPAVNRDGYLLLSGVPAAFTDPACRAPFTRLHLVDQIVPTTSNNYAQQQGFRPWQRNGITLTGNNDQSYIGHRYGDVDNTDFVIQWSDNPGSSQWGTDRLKFVFTSLYGAGAVRGAHTMNGLEAMRLYPVTYEEVNVGIGDFSQAGMGDPHRTCGHVGWPLAHSATT